MNVHNFWQALSQWKKLVQYKNEYDEFCGLCFEPDCGCDVEKVSYQDALDELTYWADINIMEAKNSDTGLVQVNQGYDRDHVYPFLPPIEEGQGVEGVERRIPQDVPLQAYIVRGNRQWFYADGEFTLLDDVFMPQGIIWGATLEDTFYPIARYDWPLWRVYKGSPPYGAAVIITDRVPNYDMRIVKK